MMAEIGSVQPARRAPVGLVTGFEPFAGLPSNPANSVLPYLADCNAHGIGLVTCEIPVSMDRVPALVSALIDEHAPVFVLSLGLAMGAPTLRVETMAINAAHFGVPDNDGARPEGGASIAEGPAAMRATWDAGAVMAAVEAEGVPARLSFHAGTHLCNLTLYTCLSLLGGRSPRVPCGFLHLPYLPEQIVWMRRRANAAAGGAAWDQPSMALDLQVRAVKAAVSVMARQALADAPTG
ncbi:MAG TPA: pyroglutamyl-peptidase I [Methylomirabilota bacterium]|nr:pyroglutamyl-peptidase I [Methylomirabilota bacterium]